MSSIAALHSAGPRGAACPRGRGRAGAGPTAVAVVCAAPRTAGHSFAAPGAAPRPRLVVARAADKEAARAAARAALDELDALDQELGYLATRPNVTEEAPPATVSPAMQELQDRKAEFDDELSNNAPDYLPPYESTTPGARSPPRRPPLGEREGDKGHYHTERGGGALLEPQPPRWGTADQPATGHQFAGWCRSSPSWTRTRTRRPTLSIPSRTSRRARGSRGSFCTAPASSCC
mmetsp:Transcript_40483/g.129026  ORF Transcript_40483/g.129026 Transcript_40483/m.129026 type:complete len:234 (-) Transcript_40483:313-1014(-)